MASGPGSRPRDGNRAYRFGRAIQAGRVWANCYHAYPPHAAFGGYKQSGIGRETHTMMLDHYQQKPRGITVSRGFLLQNEHALLLGGLLKGLTDVVG
ncbi:aldehyde dehydrogenase family protein [Mesorhizobium sp. M0768]|uniref:aldehyde dehydrogenase family protein n=1 Tax=Mesorhizobium sp. M0768 TaxID=2956996 RepID=UPI003338E8E7